MSDSVYRLSRAHAMCLVAPVIIALGAVWLVCTLTGVIEDALAVLLSGTAVVLAVASFFVLRPPRVLSLSDTGYRVGFVRGVGRGRASWLEVEGVETRPVGDALSLVLAAGDGSSSVVPLTLLGARRVEAERDIHDRLNRANGYRAFDQPHGGAAARPGVE